MKYLLNTRNNKRTFFLKQLENISYWREALECTRENLSIVEHLSQEDIVVVEIPPEQTCFESINS